MRRSPLTAVSVLAMFLIAACSSTQDLLEPSAIAAAPPTETAFSEQGDASMAQPAPQTEPASAAASQTAVIRPGTRLRFDSIVGATVEAVTPLNERLASRARAAGIKIAGNTDPSTTHVLKGYFSTLSEGGETTVIYVWDVYDAEGNRLHRINGQQKAGSTAGEGWSDVPPATMQAIADTTIEQLTAWLAGSTG